MTDEKCAPAPQATAKDLAEQMSRVHISRVAELPRIELYLDQVLNIVDDELSFMALPGEEILTGSMVNNYVKRKLVSAPQRKRYTRRQVASLLFVSALKRVYSIAQIEQIMGMITSTQADVAVLYDEVVAALECALQEQFSVGADFVAPAVEPRITLQAPDGAQGVFELARVLEAAVVSLAAKIYVDKMLAAHGAQHN